MNARGLMLKVRRGELSVAAALTRLRSAVEADLGFAHVDTDRASRCGLPEVVYCPGKTPEQVVAIMDALARTGRHVLATRVSPEQWSAIHAAHPRAVWHADARAATLDRAPLPRRRGLVAVVTAGTADIPVGEEAALVAERMGARVLRVFDVGVAGLHRAVRHLDRLRRARAIVVAAGFEGALPSVIGGLVSCPIVAVPTSTGYGASLGGLTALLAMLNSCVPGVTVVNIDNGFGAGVAAALINRAGTQPAALRRPPTPRSHRS
jgi:NCAIR mutase (PurE)-related protein